jgi:hypothetical protein
VHNSGTHGKESVELLSSVAIVFIYSPLLEFLGSLWGQAFLSAISWIACAWHMCNLRTAYTQLPYTEHGDFAAQLLTPELTDNLCAARCPSRASPDRAAYVRAHTHNLCAVTVKRYSCTRRQSKDTSRTDFWLQRGVSPVAGIGERGMWGDDNGLPLRNFARCYLPPDSVSDRRFWRMLL